MIKNFPGIQVIAQNTRSSFLSLFHDNHALPISEISPQISLFLKLRPAIAVFDKLPSPLVTGN
jgi:hypothetical protein